MVKRDEKGRFIEGPQTHGATTGGEWSHLYRVWHNMKGRCNNPNNPDYKYYGGRGIKIKWPNFQEFRDWAIKNGYDPDLEIDREDRDGNYSPENCRWVTPKENRRNRRGRHWITFRGETKMLADWARETGINYKTIRSRIEYLGWSVEKALTTEHGNKKMITYNGKTQCISEWAKEKGIKRLTLAGRLRAGWSVKKALTKPVKGSS